MNEQEHFPPQSIDQSLIRELMDFSISQQPQDRVVAQGLTAAANSTAQLNGNLNSNFTITPPLPPGTWQIGTGGPIGPVGIEGQPIQAVADGYVLAVDPYGNMTWKAPRAIQPYNFLESITFT